MANLTVKLYIRIKTEGGKKPFCEPVYLSKGRLKALYIQSAPAPIASNDGMAQTVP